MKNPFRPAALVLCVACLGPASARAQNAPLDATYESGAEQERLRTQTERLRKELAALLDGFRAYPSAAPEVARAQAALADLGNMSDKEMLETLQVLRQAGRTGAPGQARDKLLAASAGQKRIEGTLRQLADRLSSDKDQASMHTRIRDLILRQNANQHQTRHLLDGKVPEWVVADANKLVIAEQRAIRTEAGQLTEALGRPGQTREARLAQAFAAALLAARNTQLAAHAEAAVATATAKDLPGSMTEQTSVAASLQAMLFALDSAATPVERAQALADAMKELAAREDHLATVTAGAYYLHQEAKVAEPQQRLDDEAAILAQELAPLSPGAAAQFNQARGTIQQIGQTLAADKTYLGKESQRAALVGAEKTASRQMTQAAAVLQQQIAAVAGQSTPAAPAPDGPLPQIEAAAGDITAAESEMGMAIALLNQGNDVTGARQHLDQAEKLLDRSMSRVNALGSDAPKAVGEELRAANQFLSQASAKAADPNGMVTGWIVKDGIGKADQAMASLQQLASQTAMNAANAEAARKAGPSGAPPGGPGGRETNRNAGPPISAHFTTQDRAALAVLEREPVSPEYRLMVEEYRKNLADPQMPATQ